MGITLDDISPMCKACENTNGQPNGECLNKCGAAVKKLREEYERAYNQLAQAHPYTLGSFHLNLTTNWCGDGYSPLPFVLEQQNSHTADGYFEEFSSSLRTRIYAGNFLRDLIARPCWRPLPGEKGRRPSNIPFCMRTATDTGARAACI